MTQKIILREGLIISILENNLYGLKKANVLLSLGATVIACLNIMDGKIPVLSYIMLLEAIVIGIYGFMLVLRYRKSLESEEDKTESDNAGSGDHYI